MMRRLTRKFFQPLKCIESHKFTNLKDNILRIYKFKGRGLA